MMGRVRRRAESWRIGVYAKKEDLGGILEDLERWVGEREEGIRTIIGGDFNARTGREGGSVEEGNDREEEGKGEEDRRTKNWIRREGY